MGTIFLYEIAGTAMLMLLGVGVVANVVLTKTKGNGGGWLLISFGWGLAVFAGVFVAFKTGAHLDPAVTFGILFSGKSEYAEGSPVDFANTVAYLAAEVIGAMIGAFLAWAASKKHYDEEEAPGSILVVFAAGPEVRPYAWTFLTELVATFVLGVG